MQNKRVPLRMCTGCREMKPKKSLVRVVRSSLGEVSIDLVGRKPGRGAYVCQNLQCLQKAQKSRGFERALNCRIEPEVYSAMEEELRANE